ncbi:uncharacterized protein LOC115623508 [Scaptodrosophila lebanonensis]|uniref:Uncharacterized protein LOC115623508 n=1 Tax=Drosophila lebanonensis TaxID=7225 RepID=A0A6J2TF57_DROLE|nr:uncharacterized protein LOC115623508 [Scaptodrosophila lebanonensis]
MWKMLLSVALLCLFAASALGQDQTVDCVAAQGISFNNTELFSTWYEVARNPAAASNCIEVSTKLSQDNTTLSLTVAHSATLSSNYMNVNEVASLALTNQTNGTNLVFSVNGQNQSAIFVKLLEQKKLDNGKSFLIGCGQTTPGNANTTYGFFLQNITASATADELYSLNQNASLKYSFFNATSNITSVNQSGCFRNSADRLVPAFSALMALFYMLLKAF